ncbi:hypothetical protein BSY19_4700 (plasmid) [Bosea sp. RAC05]|nr:hypothetical protein BSY19_4700 [Bosea sp. RAC05]
MPAMITDSDHVCVLCGEHLAGCSLCGTTTVVKIDRSGHDAGERELALQERAIRRAAEMRQGFSPLPSGNE